MAASSRSSVLLQQLIRNACVNDGSSGNEVLNADLLSGIVEHPGVDLEIVDAAPGRRSVVARWAGTDPTAPSTMLLTHLDVVPAVPSRWRHDPFGGELVENEIWGRGAVDMLAHAATMAHAFADVASAGQHLRGDLVFAAVADEEGLGTWGAEWLLDHHAELMAADWVLTEGGGVVLGDGQVSVLIADKGAWRVELLVTGEQGHSSVPFGMTNAIETAAEVVNRIAAASIPAVVCEPWELVVRHPEGLNASEARTTARQFEDMLASLPREVARVVHACTHLTVTPTTLSTDASWNTISPQVRVGLDVRTLPGQGWADVEEVLNSALGNLVQHVDIRRTAGSSGAFTPPDTPLWALMERATRGSAAGSRLTPVMGGMTTDARFFRERGALAYGVGLMSTAMTPAAMLGMVHGDDERIDLESIDLLAGLWAGVVAELG